MNSSLRMDAASGSRPFSRLASASLKDTSLTFSEKVEKAFVRQNFRLRNERRRRRFLERNVAGFCIVLAHNRQHSPFANRGVAVLIQGGIELIQRFFLGQVIARDSRCHDRRVPHEDEACRVAQIIQSRVQRHIMVVEGEVVCGRVKRRPSKIICCRQIIQPAHIIFGEAGD